MIVKVHSNYKYLYIYYYLVIVAGTTFSRYWQIRVDQIPCGTLYTPPHGCVQYFMAAHGNFKSYNFGLNDDDYHHLAYQVYSICIRREAGRCSISYVAANEGESFYLSQTPTTVAVRSKSGEKGCPADYLTIPNGSNSQYGEASCIVSILSSPTQSSVSVLRPRPLRPT